uniref:Uncharacterized protein n=1 Tax=Picea glauca TaxID=3330 RepID=A0A101LVF7_PICGL|nr:hypothetical protein ABT39_MTgene2713 [Picea glauca]KUM46075.1 hypothetical protein ABT39_MTgene1881 [Picea glauca]KUM51038.1 hypothetical protein ABT39_MTgene884 [Picea glauca]
MNAQITSYEVKDVMFYLGFDVNILSNKSREMMGSPRLFYSPI